MSRTCLRAAAVLLALVWCAAAPPLHAQPPAGNRLRDLEPERLTLSVGAFELFRGTRRKDLEIGGEVQLTPLRLQLFGRHLPPLAPIVGGSVTEATSIYAYAGLRWDIAWGAWTFSPSAAGGIYSRGYGKRLGGTVEFRTAIEVSREVGGGRLGLCLYHLSNARIYELNPGSESLVLSYSLPLRRR